MCLLLFYTYLLAHSSSSTLQDETQQCKTSTEQNNKSSPPVTSLDKTPESIEVSGKQLYNSSTRPITSIIPDTVHAEERRGLPNHWDHRNFNKPATAENQEDSPEDTNVEKSNNNSNKQSDYNQQTDLQNKIDLENQVINTAQQKQAMYAQGAIHEI